MRRINKLKKLYKKIEKEKEQAKKLSKCTCCLVILFLAFTVAITTDFFLPIAFNYQKDYYADENSDLFDKEKGEVLNVAYGILGMILSSVICCPYTIIMIYNTKRKRYISGDFLYDKQINDDISLMKTVQLVCGYSFAIVYCNLYFWKTIYSTGDLGKPYYYDEIVIPDYMIEHGLSVYMIIKIVIIIVSLIGNIYFNDTSIFKNDLAEYNKCGDYCEYDKEGQFNYYIINILKKEN